MIRYSLHCSRGHTFEAWFQSAAAFDTQRASDQLDCPECGDREVSKSVMAPRVVSGRDRSAAGPTAGQVAAFRKAVEAGTEDVGPRFASRARAMHLGDEPRRAIRGEATAQEARSLIEDGISIFPLPGKGTRSN